MQDDGSFMHGLYKLHSVGALGKSLEMLKDMETCCVQEVQQFIASDSNINPELDELMKDCVEAEVKFYRWFFNGLFLWYIKVDKLEYFSISQSLFVINANSIIRNILWL